MSDDLKYVLLPTIENRRRAPKFQPWYVHIPSSFILSLSFPNQIPRPIHHFKVRIMMYLAMLLSSLF